jgi:hypothetical protein
MDDVRKLMVGQTVISKVSRDKSAVKKVIAIFLEGIGVDELSWDAIGGTDIMLIFEDGTWAYGDNVWENKK